MHAAETHWGLSTPHLPSLHTCSLHTCHLPHHHFPLYTCSACRVCFLTQFLFVAFSIFAHLLNFMEFSPPCTLLSPTHLSVTKPVSTLHLSLSPLTSESWLHQCIYCSSCMLVLPHISVVKFLLIFLPTSSFIVVSILYAPSSSHLLQQWKQFIRATKIRKRKALLALRIQSKNS